MKIIKLLLIVLFTFLPTSLWAYSVNVNGQALSSHDANVQRYNITHLDAATSASHNTGWVTTASTHPSFGGRAISQASVDLASGEIQLYGRSEGGAYAHSHGSGSFTESVMFNYTGDVDFSLSISGTSTNLSDPSAPTGSTIFASASLGFSSIGSGSIQNAANVLGQTYTGTTSVVAGAWYTVHAYVNFANSTQNEINLLNTATFSFNLPAGANFTSSSGVFLSHQSAPSPVPEPAAMLLMGTGLAGLAGTRLRFKK